MADRPQNSVFPAPPPFYQHFTRRNLELHKLQQDEASVEDDSNLEHTVKPDSERALQYLTPPEPPQDGKWRAFGIEHELDAAPVSLQDAGIEQLFPDHPSVKLAPQTYLLSMARSLLTTFLATTTILAQNPTLYAKKVEDLRTIVINMHYLINQYRPHQARETLIGLMEDRVDNMRTEINAIQQAREKLATFMADTREIEQGHNTDHGSPSFTTSSQLATSNESQDLAELWKILEDIPLPQEDATEPTKIEDVT